ncbi:ParM/StbA family protein [Mechercharimyces sp. CAU 1602]|uniref:ParM/StbA family protein n=1 Tax=Mechercharimyces sp. CAU 1602 TaxID=2973933 RepID=UPI0021627ED8|nr:ParM/StbA family protein [Mechercharimyces sp. CAU 1602]MCS1350522.1 ParM/StbA family protein [Mechercharimyces sp. CAU 1602]
MIIAVDCGRSHVKVMTEKKTFSFPSKISTWRKRNFRQELEGDIELIYNDRCWFIGKLAEREGEFTRQAMQDTKVVDETLLLTLAAIHLAEGAGRIQLIMGLPIQNYNEGERVALRKLLEGMHEVSINGEMRKFQIERVYITIEGGSAFFTSPRMGLVRIVDVGAKTTNYATFKDKVFIDRDSGTLPIGWETVSESNVEEMANHIAGTVSKKWQAKDMVMLIGGVASKVEPHLQEHFPYAFTLDDPQMANVRGFFEVGRAMVKCNSK